VHAAEDDELGVRPGGRLLGQLEGVAGDVGELDDLVTLVVVAEHEDPVAEGGLGRGGASHQFRIAGRRQVAGTVDTALGIRVGATAQKKEHRRRCHAIHTPTT
jgi:hypothetical protein